MTGSLLVVGFHNLKGSPARSGKVESGKDRKLGNRGKINAAWAKLGRDSSIGRVLVPRLSTIRLLCLLSMMEKHSNKYTFSRSITSTVGSTRQFYDLNVLYTKIYRSTDLLYVGPFCSPIPPIYPFQFPTQAEYIELIIDICVGIYLGVSLIKWLQKPYYQVLGKLKPVSIGKK